MRHLKTCSFATGLSALSVISALAAPVLNPANNHYYDYVGQTGTWFDAGTRAEGMTHLGLPGHRGPRAGGGR